MKTSTIPACPWATRLVATSCTGSRKPPGSTPADRRSQGMSERDLARHSSRIQLSSEGYDQSIGQKHEGQKNALPGIFVPSVSFVAYENLATKSTKDTKKTRGGVLGFQSEAFASFVMPSFWFFG